MLQFLLCTENLAEKQNKWLLPSVILGGSDHALTKDGISKNGWRLIQRRMEKMKNRVLKIKSTW